MNTPSNLGLLAVLEIASGAVIKVAPAISPMRMAEAELNTLDALITETQVALTQLSLAINRGHRLHQETEYRAQSAGQPTHIVSAK